MEKIAHKIRTLPHEKKKRYFRISVALAFVFVIILGFIFFNLDSRPRFGQAVKGAPEFLNQTKEYFLK